MHPRMKKNRSAWEVAATKYLEETDDLLEWARTESSLLASERALLAPIVEDAEVVVHLQSGHGLDDLDLARAGAGTVIGVDFSSQTVSAARHRADELGLDIAYIVADCLQVGLRNRCADLVYTGKGALMWLPDLDAWATEVARLVRPGGYLFVHEAHPAACLWTSDTDQARIRPDRSYFASTRTNDTFPASAIEQFGNGTDLDAIEWQWTLADILNAIISAGLDIRHVGEHPEPFWQPANTTPSAAWSGRLPNTFSLLAQTS